MREKIKNYSGGGVPITDEELVHNAVALAASATSANAFVDVERFSQAVVLIDMNQNFTVTFHLSNNNTDSYELDQKTAQAAGKRAYVVNVKGAKYLNVTVTNGTASAATLSTRVMLATG
ncbi:hypothetical protein [Paenibacillus alkalitolerans]|uniref:hypothetical protein n=1 Tax=Paenibacillus alkalitolerans TaxID=2799335 RepID=UPI0018F7C35D|nr:hypothetical protein [Paenibacillus alkalitolerans]